VNSPVATLSSEEIAASVKSFAEAVGYVETDLHDLFQRVNNVPVEQLNPEQKAKFDKARQKYLRCLQEFGLQEIPSDQ
jgi:hypothetical protein